MINAKVVKVAMRLGESTIRLEKRWIASHFLGSRDLGVQPLGDSLRNLALDRKQVIQIALVLFGPDMRVRSRVDQLRIYMKPGTAPANTSLQHMRYSQLVTDLPHIPLAAVIHHAGPADDFQIGDLRQLGQNVVLHTISERRVFSFLAKIFKWQNGDSSCYRMTDQ